MKVMHLSKSYFQGKGKGANEGIVLVAAFCIVVYQFNCIIFALSGLIFPILLVFVHASLRCRNTKSKVNIYHYSFLRTIFSGNIYILTRTISRWWMWLRLLGLRKRRQWAFSSMRLELNQKCMCAERSPCDCLTWFLYEKVLTEPVITTFFVPKMDLREDLVTLIAGCEKHQKHIQQISWEQT